MTDTDQDLERVVALLQEIAAHLPGSEQYVMVHHPAFRVRKKPFAIAGMHVADLGPTVSVNLGRDAQSALLADPRFERTPYIGQHGWVTVAFEQLGDGELETLVTDSWRRVAPRKLLRALDGED